MDNAEREGFIAYSTLPSFKRKVEKAKETIKEALAIAPAYVAVSWGKDSTVLLHLCQQVKPDILAVNFTSEWRNLIDNYQDVIDSYRTQFNPNYREYNTDYQEKSKLYWDGLLDTNPMVFLGCRGEESKHRMRAIRTYGLIYQYQSGIRKGSYRCFPLAYWTWQDIWPYICSNNLPYLSSYDHILNQGRDKSRTAIIHKSHKYHSHIDIILANNQELLRTHSPEFYREFIKTYYE